MNKISSLKEAIMDSFYKYYIWGGLKNLDRDSILAPYLGFTCFFHTHRFFPTGCILDWYVLWFLLFFYNIVFSYFFSSLCNNTILNISGAIDITCRIKNSGTEGIYTSEPTLSWNDMFSRRFRGIHLWKDPVDIPFFPPLLYSGYELKIVFSESIQTKGCESVLDFLKECTSKSGP